MPQDAATPPPATPPNVGASPAASRLPPGLPQDWHFELDYECLKCRYNLKMLREPRCPECGDEFRWQQILHTRCPRCDQPLDNCDGEQCPRCAIELNWPALIGTFDRRAMSHYEYTPRPWQAAPRVALAALMPYRFWSKLPLEWSPVPQRVRRFRVQAWSLGGLGLAALMLFQFYLSGFVSIVYALTCFAAAFVLPLVTVIGLPLFQPTLARFRVRSDQLLRVTSYLSALVGWLGALYLLTAVICASIWGFTAIGPAIGLPAMPYLVYYDPISSIEALVLADGQLAFRGRGLFWAAYVRELSTVVLGLTVWFGVILWLWSAYCALAIYLRLDRRNALILLACIAAISLLLTTMALLVDHRAMVILGRLLM